MRCWLHDQEGPSGECLRLLVPKAIEAMGFGSRHPKHEVPRTSKGMDLGFLKGVEYSYRMVLYGITLSCRL